MLKYFWNLSYIYYKKYYKKIISYIWLEVFTLFPHWCKILSLYLWFESRDKILLVTSSTEIMTLQPLFQNSFILRRPGVAIFADIIKIITRFIKKIFKDSRKVKRIRNYVSKCNLYLYFLILQNLLISREKMLMSAILRGCVTWLIYFSDLL